ncbi:alkaline phosphatase family protein [Myroides sp. N17-2]|uniref:alkaline phosphatase family protein n=1 Tax=Myroides sp. N17-2 TaxID=2030799 RepID=UPI000EFA4182|nr:ectonucleotide pyrophosphatase/phosphodiesterase [Myroides sp. N17-2]
MKKIFVIFSLLIGFSSLGQKVKHVVLVSIDGFRPDFYTEKHWATPNLKYMADNGVVAKGVKTIFPSVTYPSHTTLSTGVLPNKHGVYYNTNVELNTSKAQWVYHSSQVKSSTIWQWAKEKGLVTASVSWPITLDNAYIDYNLPEIWDFKNPSDRIKATLDNATPKGLFEEVLDKAVGKVSSDEFNLSSLSMDENLGRSAAYILKTYKPNLLTLHLPNTDGAQHSYGREHYEVQRAVAGADKIVGNLLDAIQKAGLEDDTVIIVTGDHGFVTTDFALSPNIWLKENGLFDKAYFFSSGGSTLLHLYDYNDTKIVTKVKEVLDKLPHKYKEGFEIISEQQIQLRGADPRVKLALSGKLGYSFTNNSTGEVLTSSKGGKHGYYPSFQEIYTGFVAYGKPVKKGLVINTLNLEDIPVIIGKMLNLSLPDVDGVALPITIEK